MIIGFIKRVFGPPPIPQVSEPEQKELPAEAPVSQRLEEPELPVEPGFHYTRDLDHYERAEPPKLKASSLEHLWSGEASREELATDLRAVELKALREGIRDSEIEKLIDRDQERSDFDRRDGHVVLPDSQFEYHGSLNTVRYPETEGSAVREGTVYTLRSDSGHLTYDTESRDLSYLPDVTHTVEGTDFSHHTKVVARGVFQLSEEGEVTIPSADNLEEAEGITEQRDLAFQAQQLIESHNQFRKTSEYRLDQRDEDHDQRPKHVVADKIDEYWFLKDTQLPHMKHQTYSVESTPQSLRVYEDSYNKKPELVIEAKTEGTRTEIQRAHGKDHSLHLVWNRAEQSVAAELRQDKDYVAPEPKREPAQRTYTSSRSRSYTPTPRPQRDPNQLPHGFTSSNRRRSHGGGHHVMVSSENNNFHASGFPDKFTDPGSGKSYRKTSYGVLNGSRMYVEQR